VRTPVFTKQFERDVKWMWKRGKNLHRLKVVLSILVEEEQLTKQYRDHILAEENKTGESAISSQTGCWSISWLLMKSFSSG